MILKYEKLSDILDKDNKVVLVDGETVKTFSECDSKDATHVHKCRHDEVPPKACSREKI